MKYILTLAILLTASSLYAQTCQTCQPAQPQQQQPMVMQPMVMRTPGLLTPLGRFLFGRRVVVNAVPVQPRIIVQPQPPQVFQYIPGQIYQTPGSYMRIQ